MNDNGGFNRLANEWMSDYDKIVKSYVSLKLNPMWLKVKPNEKN